MTCQYNCQQFLAIRREKVIIIPDNCVIDKTRLSGLSNEEFVSAFRTLQETMISIFDDAISNPEAWGYPLEPYRNSEHTGDYNLSAHERIPDVLEALFSSGKIIDKSLHVDISAYKNKVKKHKKNNLILEKLNEMGFEISGFERGSTEYVVSFPDNANAVIVLNSYIQAANDAMAPIKPTLHVAMRALIGCLFYRLVEDKSTQKYDTIFHVMTDSFSDDARKMCYALYDSAKDAGHSYQSYYNDCHHQISFDKYFSLMYNFLTKEVHSKIILHKLMTPKKIQKLYDMPDNLQECFAHSTCTYCSGNKPSDGTCTMRICYDWHGEPTEGCAYHSFKFRNLHQSDLPYLIDMYKEEFLKK